MRPGSLKRSRRRDGIRSCGSKRRCRFEPRGTKPLGPSGNVSNERAESGKGKENGVRKESGCRAQCSCGFEQGYEEPICAVSDLPASEAKTAWYQLRFWIEDEYKDGKRGWFHWEHTKMTKSERASRLWLVVGIAMQNAVLLGGELEAQEQEVQRKNHRRHGGKSRRPGRPA